MTDTTAPILVTGGTGLIGSHLVCKLLAKGRHVRAIKRATSDTRIIEKLLPLYGADPEIVREHLEWVDASLENPAELEWCFADVHLVFHCAGAVSFNPGKKQSVRTINVGGTGQIVRLCLEAGVKTLCHVSSSASLGKLGNEPIHEDTPWDDSADMSEYARSKYAAEAEVLKGIEQGLRAVIVNPVIVLGPGDWNRSSLRIFRTIAKGMPAYPAGANAIVDVRDVTEAMLGLVGHDVHGERFVLAGHNVTYKELFGSIAREMGKSPPRIKITPPLAEVVLQTNALVRRISGKGLPLHRSTLSAGLKKHYFSSEKVKKVLDLEFTPLDKTIRDTWDFIEAHYL